MRKRKIKFSNITQGNAVYVQNCQNKASAHKEVK